MPPMGSETVFCLPAPFRPVAFTVVEAREGPLCTAYSTWWRFCEIFPIKSLLNQLVSLTHFSGGKWLVLPARSRLPGPQGGSLPCRPPTLGEV